MREIGIMQVGGFRLGHAQDETAATGCTVLLSETLAAAGLDVRGGGPASRESMLLHPLTQASGVHAVLLSGGSAFGLDAAGGVMRYLEERQIGLDVGVARVPLVCQSSLFDLAVGSAQIRPDADMAYRACQAASYEAPAQGNVGVGTGCTVGKYKGVARAMKSGFGTYAIEAAGIRIGAIVAVNALGDIYDIDSGVQLAGVLAEDGKSLCQTEALMTQEMGSMQGLWAGNTTLGIVVTNANFTKPMLCKIASMAHNGFARAIRPVHTMADGDCIYALSTGQQAADVNVVGTLAATVMGRAIARATQAACTSYGVKGMDALK